ncbi:MAG: Gfo/Idh/MocA family oxidoreductase [Chloroflexi bacterium]|nr:Gfo/Idh/MocA family oxidoreductase [Chloroflexota bacterium]
MRVAIVGCGLIGRKRAAALGAHQLVACADISLGNAERLAASYPDCVASADYREIVQQPDVDAVIVSTTNNVLATAAVAAAEAGKHVLVEKPAARYAFELGPLLAAAQTRGVVVKVGFNHRFHPAFQKARAIVDAGGIGELVYIRARYGHGGRPGYDREWRADPEIAGGGEMLDQGVHLIDLSRWFCGDFVEVAGHVATFYWQMPVEDNGFAILKTASGQVAWLHASCTEWKNLFSFEIFGCDGKLQIDGLGGSYGTERLTYYRMLPEMGPPETSAWEYPREDRSWHAEIEHWVACIETGQQLSGTVEDAIAALTIVERLYEVSGRDHHA